MNIDPLGSIGLSALVASIPIIFLGVALAIIKMKGHIAATIATALAFGIAVLVYGMPASYASGQRFREPCSGFSLSAGSSLRHCLFTTCPSQPPIRSHQELTGFDL